MAVHGVAGTGKSTMINVISNLVKSRFGDDALVVTAPTGVDAFNIKGKTIHSLLEIQNFKNVNHRPCSSNT